MTKIFQDEEEPDDNFDGTDGYGTTPQYDQLEEAVTSFTTRQEVEPSPLPQSDSSHPRSHDTPEPPTSSNSTSVQKTVIQRQPAVTNPQGEEGDSDWDSEVGIK